MIWISCPIIGAFSRHCETSRRLLTALVWVWRGGAGLPVMEQRRRRVGVSPWYWLIIPLAAATGTGMVRVIGLWNFRLLGSMVTMGDTATRLPSSLAVSSGGIGWA